MSNEKVFAEVCRRLGVNLTELTDLLGEKSVQTVSNWRTRGIPANRCKAIEALTGISVRTLRPNDWQDYWPEPVRLSRRLRA